MQTAKKVIFIGQAPARPTSKHGVAGTYIRPWLYQLGLDDASIDKQCRFYALIDSFPGSDKKGHLKPTPEQMQAYRPALMKLLHDFQPDSIVPVGAMAISEVMERRGAALVDVVGKQFSIDPFNALGHEITAIPLPHPSGRSTWLAQHRDLLDDALLLLRQSL